MDVLSSALFGINLFVLSILLDNAHTSGWEKIRIKNSEFEEPYKLRHKVFGLDDV